MQSLKFSPELKIYPYMTPPSYIEINLKKKYYRNEIKNHYILFTKYAKDWKIKEFIIVK